MVKTVEGETFVEAKSSLKLCDRFLFPSTKGRCEQHPCDKLHICRGFLEDSCAFGETCKKPHGFDNSVIENLLTQHNLDSLSSDDLKKLFQKTLKEHKIKYATSALGPRACSVYIKGGTCKEEDRCNFLHVCEKYIKGSCKSAADCGLCHSFETKHARRVLATHNLGDLRDEEKILSKLRSNMGPQPQTFYENPQTSSYMKVFSHLKMKPQSFYEKPQTSLDMKLFSHLIAHGENCRLPIADVEICLQEFGEDEVTY